MPVDPHTLAYFVLAVLLLLVSPGPNMLFVLANGAGHGWRGGLAAAVGIGAADIVSTLACAFGLAGLIAAYPAAFDLVRWAGAAYLLYLAYRCVAGAGAKASPSGSQREARLPAIFLRGLLSSLANPKSVLFFIVFIPQFVDTGHGSVLLQFMLLGTVLAVIGTAFHGAIGAMGAAGGRLAAGWPGARKALAFLQAAIFGLIAGRLLLG